MTQLISTQVSEHLKGKESVIHFNQMSKMIDDEVATVRAKMRSGMDRSQYEIANKKIDALQASKLILKTIQIFHSE